MFTGIIESTGYLIDVMENKGNRTMVIESTLTPELRVDQSLSHDGVCLTVEHIKGNSYQVTAIEETLNKTAIGSWKPGRRINLERCLQMGGRLDGHIVQGHVDAKATCIGIIEKAGSIEFTFSFDSKFASLIIEKGSISLNGISLTIFNITDTSFTVAIIPYTLEHTNMGSIAIGDEANVEFDMLGKYVQRMNSLNAGT